MNDNFFSSIDDIIRANPEIIDQFINRYKNVKIGYKGFKNIKGELFCKNTFYKVGDVHTKEGNFLPLKTCTDMGFHYCNNLTDVFSYYSRCSQHLFGEVEILGDFVDDDSNKSITTSFRVKKLLSSDEIDKIIIEEKKSIQEREEKKQKDEKRKKEESIKNLIIKNKENELKIFELLSEKYPSIILGGSTALFLHGVRLNRWVSNKSDLDIISPNFDLFERVNGLTIDKEPNDFLSGCDFDYSIGFSNSIFGPGKIDVRIDPKHRYEVIEYKGKKYKIALLEVILEAKIKYSKSKKSGQKHKKDIHDMVLSNDLNIPIYNDEPVLPF